MFCTPHAAGSGSDCRAFIMHFSAVYVDGTVHNMSTAAGSPWEGTISENPIVYDHLFNGEIRDMRVGDRLWDSPKAPGGSAAVADGWSPAEVYALSHNLGSQLTLLSMPPMAVTEKRAPLKITPISGHPRPPLCPGDFLAGSVDEGGEITLSCGNGTGTISKVEFASFGQPKLTSYVTNPLSFLVNSSTVMGLNHCSLSSRWQATSAALECMLTCII